MVDFLYSSTVEEKNEKENEPEFDEYSLSFADSLLDYDSLRDFILDTDDDDDDVGTRGILVNKEETQIGVHENRFKVELPMPMGVVEEEMGKVSISGIQNERGVDQAGNNSISIDEAGVSKNEESDKVDVATSRAEERILSNSDAETESESSSNAEEEDARSSSNEEAEWEEEDIEEGEILPSDSDEDTGVRGPIRSKNEVQVLPPVPEVTATLQPHHQMQPVGVVSSIIGAQVVVEGVEKHTPLNDDSILWITESRSPLGIVDEIFGPVRNPYYIVRYNSNHEVPPGVHPGTLISFVPEFSNHILNDNSLYKKGYDASGENDEEVSEDEFSDDEKEAEYKRMLKMKKRGIINDQKTGYKKKDKKNRKSRSQNWKHDQGAATDVQRENVKPSIDQSQRFIPAAASAPLDPGIHPSASLQGPGLSIRPSSVPSFLHIQNSPGLAAQSTGVWTNGIPYQQPQKIGFPNTLPNVDMTWPQQGHPAQIFQMPLPNALPFEQQINPALLSRFMFSDGLPNFGPGPSFAAWPALGQSVFSQSPMAMGLPGQFTPTPMNLGGQIPANGPQSGQNNNSQPHAVVPGSSFNQGAHSSGGWRENHRGGGRFGGRIGRSQYH
ncbi:putative H/ACA ribonucleoprotein complex non-core subunit NAF1-like isoform X2 [Capsicum annuum]|nr:putative H/ACA ribonucleoprotein complex non-core subunit NAF1-like isoform X2 [Capsicum annuum]